MGKTRRARSKFHISSVQGDFKVSPSDYKFSIPEISNDNHVKGGEINTNCKNDIDLEQNSSVETNTIGEWKVIPEDDLFKNLDIDVDKLETSVQDTPESRPASISISKCIKRSVAESGINVKLKKGDKRELRRNLFIKKIDAIHQEIRRKKSRRESAELNGKKLLDKILSEKTYQDVAECPKVSRLQNQSFCTKHLTAKVSKKKQKAMCKLKNKSQEMLKNVDFYKQIISDTKYQTDAMGIVTNAVQKKVFADL